MARAINRCPVLLPGRMWFHAVTNLQHLGFLHEVVFLSNRLVVAILEQLHLLNKISPAGTYIVVCPKTENK